MSLNFDPNASSSGSVQGPSFVPPTKGEDKDIHDPTSSSISQSLVESLMVQYLMGWPVLQQPNDNASNNTNSMDGVTGVVGNDLGKIGNQMWEGYINNLQQEKQRIADYLNSPAYQQHIAVQTLGGQVSSVINATADSTNQIASVTGVDQRDNSRINAATELWTNTIDSVSNYVRDNHEANPAATAFIAASFAITSTFIGDYTNIVDVASTNMVSVTPIQDSISQVLPLVPQQLQEQFTISINLLAIGLINFSNAESILTGSQQQRAPINWETAKILAKNVFANVEGNVVNGLLMAMLVNKMEDLGGTEQQKNQVTAQLTEIAKAVMLAVAAGALLKAAMPDLKLTSDIFIATMTQPLVAQSESDKQLVDELLPLANAFSNLRTSGLLSDDTWNSIVTKLGAFFEANPNFDDVFSQTNLMGSLVQNLFNSEIEA